VHGERQQIWGRWLAEKEAQPGTVAGKNAGTALDQHAAACLLLDNQNEVALARLAHERSKNAEVQKFADMLQKDHEKIIGDLEKFAGHDFRNRLSMLEHKGNQQQNAPRPENRAGNQAGTPQNARGGEVTPESMLQIKREIADTCAASSRAELDSKHGVEFDKCYIGMQIGMHMHMADTLQVLTRHVSPELRSVLNQGLSITENHLTRAKRIMKDLDHLDTAGNTKTSTAK